jgi:hypothetical protein
MSPDGLSTPPAVASQRNIGEFVGDLLRAGDKRDAQAARKMSVFVIGLQSLVVAGDTRTVCFSEARSIPKLCIVPSLSGRSDDQETRPRRRWLVVLA